MFVKSNSRREFKINTIVSTQYGLGKIIEKIGTTSDRRYIVELLGKTKKVKLMNNEMKSL